MCRLNTYTYVTTLCGLDELSVLNISIFPDAGNDFVRHNDVSDDMSTHGILSHVLVPSDVYITLFSRPNFRFVHRRKHGHKGNYSQFPRLLGTISSSSQNGVIFGPFCLLPFVIFSGFFVQLYDVHPYFQWVFHFSYLKYAFEGLMLAIFGYNRAKIPCNADFCLYVYPEHFLEQVDMDQASYSHSMIFLVGLLVVMRLLAFISLCIKIKWRR